MIQNPPTTPDEFRKGDLVVSRGFVAYDDRTNGTLRVPRGTQGSIAGVASNQVEAWFVCTTKENEKKRFRISLPREGLEFISLTTTQRLVKEVLHE